MVVQWLTEFFKMVWKVGVAPGDWKNVIIVPIHKQKVSRMECTNYRGVSVMSIVGKVFARVLNERVKVWTVDKVTDEQGSFRTGRGLEEDVLTRSCLDASCGVKH